MMDPAALVVAPRPAARTVPRRRLESLLYAASLTAAALAFLPNLLLHLLDLSVRPYYEFLPLVPLGALALAWAPCREFRWDPAREAGRVSWLFVVAGLLLAAAAVIDSTWLGVVALLAGLLALAIDLGGGRFALAVLPAWAFLWLTIPLPAGLDKPLIALLQRLTTVLSGPVLDALGLLHATQGFVINVEGHRLLVEEACSGIGSLFIVLAAALFYALRARLSLVRAAILLCLVPLFTLLGNVGRVVTVAVVEARLGLDVGHGWRHEAVGLAACLLALALVLSADHLVVFLGAVFRFRWRRFDPRFDARATPQGPVEPPPITPHSEPGATLVPSWPGLASRSCLATPLALTLFGLLALGQWIWLWPLLFDGRLSIFPRVARFTPVIRSLGVDALPLRWQGFERLGFEEFRRGQQSELGDYSRVWEYRVGRRNVQVCLDDPFIGWHELTYCYKNLGWALEARRLRTPRGKPSDGPFVETRFTRATGGHALLFFTCLDEKSSALQPFEPSKAVAIVEGDFGRGLRSRLDASIRRRTEIHSPSLQIQLLMEGESPFSEAEQAEARAFFEHVLALIRVRLARPPGGGS